MYKFIIKGVVQGVGFRPFVYNACKKEGLKGYVRNAGSAVEVEVDDKEKFEEILKKIPPLARIDLYEMERTNNHFEDFSILESTGEGFAEIPADLFLCEDCQKELTSNTDRRRNYFFITCTNCGPRYSITRKNPYDRHTTTMESFEMCNECRGEYTNPSNKRYHAQTIACHRCGPKLSLISEGKVQTKNPIQEAASLIQRNEIVAVKGVGGFHLACNTSNMVARKLRDLTGRANKPYAILCKDIGMAEKIAFLSGKEKELLLSIQRPIVVLKKKKSFEGITELDTVGVMLPYTGLHYLLFDYLKEPVVMTSSNMSDEPITTEDHQQLAPPFAYPRQRNRKPHR